jgi:two-component system, response regulator
MAGSAVEILLVEDNPGDEELALRALRKSQVAVRVYVARDGEEVLDYLFARGAYSGRALQ